MNTIQQLIEDYGYRVRGFCGTDAVVRCLFDEATEKLCHDIHIALDEKAEGFNLNVGILAAACMYHKEMKP